MKLKTFKVVSFKVVVSPAIPAIATLCDGYEIGAGLALVQALRNPEIWTLCDTKAQRFLPAPFDWHFRAEDVAAAIGRLSVSGAEPTSAFEWVARLRHIRSVVSGAAGFPLTSHALALDSVCFPVGSGPYAPDQIQDAKGRLVAEVRAWDWVQRMDRSEERLASIQALVAAALNTARERLP